MASYRTTRSASAWRIALSGLALLLIACGRVEASGLPQASREITAVTTYARASVAASSAESTRITTSAESVGLRRPASFTVVGGADNEQVGNLQGLLERLPFRAALPTYAPPGLWLDIAGVSGLGEGQAPNFSLYFLTADESQGLLLAQGPGQGDYAAPAAGSLPSGVDLEIREMLIEDVPAVFVRVAIEGNPFSTSLYWRHCGVGFNIRGTVPLLDGATITRMAASTMHSCS